MTYELIASDFGKTRVLKSSRDRPALERERERLERTPMSRRANPFTAYSVRDADGNPVGREVLRE